MDEAFRLNSRDARNTERIAIIAVSKTCTNRKINEEDEEDTRNCNDASQGNTMWYSTSSNMLHLVKLSV